MMKVFACAILAMATPALAGRGGTSMADIVASFNLDDTSPGSTSDLEYDDSDFDDEEAFYEKYEKYNLSGHEYFMVPDEVVDRVFVGGYVGATNEQLRNDIGITHVVTVTPSNRCDTLEKLTNLKGRYRNWLRRPLADKPLRTEARILPEQDKIKFFKAVVGAFDFITAALKENNKNKILIHCDGGQNRSVAVMTACLLLNPQWTNIFSQTPKDIVISAMERVQEKRGAAKVGDKNAYYQALLKIAAKIKTLGQPETLKWLEQEAFSKPIFAKLKICKATKPAIRGKSSEQILAALTNQKQWSPPTEGVSTS